MFSNPTELYFVERFYNGAEVWSRYGNTSTYKVQYSNSDTLWFDLHGKVIKILTHDGHLHEKQTDGSWTTT